MNIDVKEKMETPKNILKEFVEYFQDQWFDYSTKW